MSHAVARHWERANLYLQQQRLPAARIELEALRAAAPDDWRCGLLAARLASRSGQPRVAASLAVPAAARVPDESDAVCEAVHTLLEVGETRLARQAFERPVWGGASDATLARYIDFAHRFGEHATALAALERLLAAHTDDGPLRFQRGLQLEYLGQLDAAARAYAACLALAPGFGQAAYQWARLHRSADGAALRTAIGRGLAVAPAGSRDRADFEFARYHALEDLGDTAGAWPALARANAIMRGHMGAAATRQLAGLRQFAAWVDAHPPFPLAASAASPCPLIILGMPRSGTTVLERMLGNHSQVVAAGELPDFGQQLMVVADTPSTYSETFYARLPTLDFDALGRGYSSQTAWRAHGRAYLVDKQPSNWMLAGLMHAALPNAKILCLGRDPMDVCFSNWRARFATYAWSYDFAALAEYHALYTRLMDAWRRLYPGAILDVAYADLVGEPETTLRRVLDFCGLPWEAGCADLVRNANPVATLSAAAVREPLNARGIGQWRRYAVELEPLRQRLAHQG
jgi:hypothetical protein